MSRDDISRGTLPYQVYGGVSNELPEVTDSQQPHTTQTQQSGVLYSAPGERREMKIHQYGHVADLAVPAVPCTCRVADLAV